MLLDACTSFCQSLGATFGPNIADWIGFALLAAVGWWRARKEIGKVEAKADAGIAEARASASKAKAEARETKVQLAEIRGSLQPSSPMIGTSSSASGNFKPVAFPPPPTLPTADSLTLDRPTPAERPSRK